MTQSPIPKQSYLTQPVADCVEARLKQLYYEAQRLKDSSSMALLLMSIEILRSLNTEALPVGINLYEFRRDINITFYVAVNCHVDYSAPLSVDLSHAHGDFRLLVTEYHLRIYNCLKVVLQHITAAFSGEPLCQRSITG